MANSGIVSTKPMTTHKSSLNPGLRICTAMTPSPYLAIVHAVSQKRGHEGAPFMFMLAAARSIHPRLRFDILRLGGERVGVDRAVIDGELAAARAPALEPGDPVLHPVGVVAVGEILVRVGAARFLAVVCALDRADGLCHQIVQLQSLASTGFPDQRIVGDRSEERRRA